MLYLISLAGRYPLRRLSVLLIALSALYSVGATSQENKVPFFTDAEVNRILLHGPWPQQPPADAGNEFSGVMRAEQLGESLFFNQQLTANSGLSCAGCHQPNRGFSDGLAVAAGVQQHVRNTQGLWNIGLHRWFGWDGGTDSLWAASLRPMLSPIEMDGNIQAIATQLRQIPDVYNAFADLTTIKSSQNDDEALVVFAAKCIAAYMRTLTSPPTAFDRYRIALAENNTAAQGNYPASAKRGLKIFIGNANCHVCHYGPDFSNGEFHDIGRPFFTGVGQVDPGRHSGIERLRKDRYNLTGSYNGTADDKEIRKTTSVKKSQANFGQWRTPTLRNLTLTAPYMHDGSVPTLADVIDTYVNIDLQRLHSKGESILKPLALTAAQQTDLVNFLETLSPDL